MAEYKRLKKAQTVLALCFAEGRERYHHWRVFASGVDGVRLTFDKDKLLTEFSNDRRIRKGYVDYKLIKEIKNSKEFTVEKLPFIKRASYEDESEYRIVYVDSEEIKHYVDYRIKISWLKRITLSPWMPRALSGSVIQTLQSIEGCSSLSVQRTTLVESDLWMKLTKRVRDCSDRSPRPGRTESAITLAKK